MSNKYKQMKKNKQINKDKPRKEYDSGLVFAATWFITFIIIGLSSRIFVIPYRIVTNDNYLDEACCLAFAATFIYDLATDYHLGFFQIRHRMYGIRSKTTKLTISEQLEYVDKQLRRRRFTLPIGTVFMLLAFVYLVSKHTVYNDVGFIKYSIINSNGTVEKYSDIVKFQGCVESTSRFTSASRLKIYFQNGDCVSLGLLDITSISMALSNAPRDTIKVMSSDFTNDITDPNKRKYFKDNFIVK